MIPAMMPTCKVLTATDPSFASVVNLSHFDTFNAGPNTYPNSCPRGNVFSTASSALDTSVFKWSPGSIVFAGATTATAATHADYAIGIADFTIEMWVRPTSLSSVPGLLDMRTTQPQVVPVLYVLADGTIQYYVNGSVAITSSAGGIVTNSWQFIQLVRNTGVSKLYVGGSQVGSNYTDINSYVQSSIKLGAFYTGTDAFSGNIDDFRFTNGVGRANAVPTAAFPNS